MSARLIPDVYERHGRPKAAVAAEHDQIPKNVVPLRPRKALTPIRATLVAPSALLLVATGVL